MKITHSLDLVSEFSCFEFAEFKIKTKMDVLYVN